MEPWFNDLPMSRSSFNGVTGDPQVLRVLYERLRQRNEARKSVLDASEKSAVSYYNDTTWRDKVTIADAHWLQSLGIEPL